LCTGLALFVLACGGAQGTPGRVSGSVSHRERIALPPDAVVQVRLEDVSRADAPAIVLVEQTIHPAGKQVPIPFVLEFDAGRIERGHRYGVRAEIRDAAGELRWTTTEAHPVLEDGASAEIDIVVRQVGGRPAAARSGPEPQRTLVFECDGLDFVVRQDAREVELYLPNRTVVAPQVPAASGAKYQEGDVTFWSKGDEASLEIGDRTWNGCRLVPQRAPWEDARLRGVMFRAVGNEPGWYLEIEPGSEMRFVGDYGSTTVSTPLPEPALDAANGRTTWHAVTEANDLEVVFETRRCVDDMSGEEFEATVTLRLNGASYRGCGRQLLLLVS